MTKLRYSDDTRARFYQKTNLHMRAIRDGTSWAVKSPTSTTQRIALQRNGKTKEEGERAVVTY